MKLHLLDRTSAQDSSFTIRHNRYPNFLKIWHHHPELELVVISKSTGTHFIGDSIEKFVEGDVVLIGKSLPHMWLNDEIYFEGRTDLVAEAIGIHFTYDFLGIAFLGVPEMKPIQKLLDRAGQGIKFKGLDNSVIVQIENLFTLDTFEKTIKFIEILYQLSKHKNYKLLTSPGFVNTFHKTGNANLDKIYSYIFKNFNTPIRSNDLAVLINMNPSAFSRYFRRIHRKTLTQYLNEIRIGYACKLLMERKVNVALVCYESGFNNISNFNRQFKTIMKMSPTAYVRLHS